MANRATESVYIEARQDALRTQLEAQRLGALLVTRPANVFYLTGFWGSAGVAAFSPRQAVLWVDPRYTLQAQEQAVGVEVVEAKHGLLPAARRWVRKTNKRRAGFDESHLTLAELRVLRDESPSAQWKPAGGLVEGLRVVKDDLEVERMTKAGQLTAQAFATLAVSIRAGVSERDLAAEAEYRMRLLGADGAAFETIVASGARGALPHARPSAKLLHSGELVIFDLGAILAGYASDMTRTVCLGEPNRRVRSLYLSVLAAQQEALDSLRAQMKASEVDAAARRALARRGLGRFFTHSTGHGVGIEVHERPRLGKGEKARIPAGSVVTVEPGIYMAGFGGVRIEDTVLVGREGIQVLTPSAKDEWCLG
jgi:Xaa-Pro aminopeptidase